MVNGSKREFVHKLKVVLKELNEARVWLKMIVRSQLLSGERLDTLLDECDQLCRIMHSSVQTARRDIEN